MNSKVDFSRYFACKMFISEVEDTGEDKSPFKGQVDKYFVLPGGYIECNIENMKIHLHVFPENKPDTMICEGQNIKLDSVICSKVIICGFGMYGSFQDKFELIYKDGSVQKQDVFFIMF